MRIEGKIIVADAAHTSVDTAIFIRLIKKSEFFMAVKGNQPTIRDEIRHFLSDPNSTKATAVPETQKYGRRERRTITVMDAPRYFGVLLPGAKQILSIVNERNVISESRNIHETTVETRYYATSLTAEEASPSDLLELRLNYWGAVENGLHHVLDVTMGEDSSRARTEMLATALSAFRKAALAVLRLAGVTEVAKARRLYRGK